MLKRWLTETSSHTNNNLHKEELFNELNVTDHVMQPKKELQDFFQFDHRMG